MNQFILDFAAWAGSSVSFPELDRIDWRQFRG
jgi:predicted NUDIX family NTP pyrophosphohydrolase